jgi:hypothetical protein
MADASF